MTRAELQALIEEDLASNGTRSITAMVLRNVLSEMVAGISYQYLPEDVRTADRTFTPADAGRMQVFNKSSAATATLFPIAASNGELLPVRNVSVHPLTIVPDDAEMIDGLPEIVLTTGQTARFWPDATKTNWRVDMGGSGGGSVDALFEDDLDKSPEEKALARLNIGAAQSFLGQPLQTRFALSSRNDTNPNNSFVDSSLGYSNFTPVRADSTIAVEVFAHFQTLGGISNTAVRSSEARIRRTTSPAADLVTARVGRNLDAASTGASGTTISTALLGLEASNGTSARSYMLQFKPVNASVTASVQGGGYGPAIMRITEYDIDFDTITWAT